MKTTEIEVVDSGRRNFSAKEIKANVQLIQEVMRAVMIDGTHYGKVPGCGDKKALLKPGSETLLMTFRIAPFPEVQDMSLPDKAHFRVRTIGKSIITGVEVGSAFGECSSEEEKYKWKGAVHQKEYDATPEDRKRIKYTRDGGEILQVRTNPSDVANTVLKMAVKRSMVALTLTVTAASDIFVQDVEDMEELPNGDGPTKNAKVPPTMPKAKSATPSGEFRAMKSKYEGKCKECSEPINIGEEIYYASGLGSYHKACKERQVGAEG